MSLGFSEIISSIESELSALYLPGAINWADDTMDGAWSKAIDRFDKALSIAIERQDYTLARIEGDFYKATIIDLIRRYKTHKRMDDTESLLQSVRKL